LDGSYRRAEIVLRRITLRTSHLFSPSTRDRDIAQRGQPASTHDEQL
jgi:hypothetical protein